MKNSLSKIGGKKVHSSKKVLRWKIDEKFWVKKSDAKMLVWVKKSFRVEKSGWKILCRQRTKKIGGVQNIFG